MADRLEKSLEHALGKRAVEALQHWTSVPGQPELLKYRENAVFRVTLADGRTAALRLHRAGYHSENALRSELDWMTALRLGGLVVPSPISASNGSTLVRLPANDRFANQYADVVSWIDGAPLGQAGMPLAQSPKKQAELFYKIGAGMAELHRTTDAWQPPGHFRRPAWNTEGLLGEHPLWGRFWDCGGLSPQQAKALASLRARLRLALAQAERRQLDYGLIHADLVRENVLVTGSDVAFIDFDDAGYGFRLFELATTLLKNRGEPTYPVIESALIDGYRSRRSLSDEALEVMPLFLVLRSLTYVGWLASRPELPNAAERMSRYIAESLRLAEDHERELTYLTR